MTEAGDDGRWLVGLDIDGTVLREDGALGIAVIEAVRRVRDQGHEVMLATGRSVSMTIPVADRLGIAPRFLVCGNGAIIMERDDTAPDGYTPFRVETFDPTEVLTTIRDHLADASFAVEDEDGVFRYTGHFPDGSLAVSSRLVGFDDLLGIRATRVVVLSPDHAIDDFLEIVERMGLHKVSYNVGWTSWLDIAPEGVNKATGMERVRKLLGVPRSRVLVVGDGRNDIEMFAWAAAEGVAVAMGQAPPEVVEAANETTGSDLEDGLADALARQFEL